MGTYTNREALALNESTQVLQEMHFSNKDLQDPKTFYKVLKDKGAQTPLKVLEVFVGVVGVAAIAVGGWFSKGLALITVPVMLDGYIAMMLEINSFVGRYPYEHSKKEMEKLKNNCKKLKENSQKQLAKHPENADKLKKIISNCDKVLKTMDDYYKKCEDETFMDMIKTAESYYKKLINYMEEPKSIIITAYSKEEDEPYFMAIANMLKIPESKIVEKIDKSTKMETDTVDSIFDFVTTYSYEKMTADVIFKISSFREARSGKEVKIVMKVTNPDYIGIIFFSPSNKKFFSINTEDFDEDDITNNPNNIFKQVSLYKELSEYMDSSEMFKKAVISVDKSLGYYKLSPAPEGVTPKELKF
jgi:hypothetical protein